MKKPFILGLTGSIGMGKSTTSQMFADLGVPVWDADATVHRLYDVGGAATVALGREFPQAIVDGKVSRPALRQLIAEDPARLDRINAVIHPLVAQDRLAFLARSIEPVVVLDIPLLFETGADSLCDGVAVVSVGPDLQRERVLSRGGMTEQDLAIILARQMPDPDKRARARWVIDTTTLAAARARVAEILSEIAHA